MQNKLILLFTAIALGIVISSCNKDENPTPANNDTQFETQTRKDTVFDFFERSADGVFHVANNPNAPVYQRYFFGTNQNWTEVAQAFDMPEVLSTKANASIDKVVLDGFRIRVAVSQAMGAKDDITYHIYEANHDRLPSGQPIHTGAFTPNGTGNLDVFINGGLELKGHDGFLISFETYAPGSDIFVVSNSYCIVSGGPNDGNAEKRTKVKMTSNGSWESLLDVGPNVNQDPNEAQKMLDCDMYVFPFLSITEKYPL